MTTRAARTMRCDVRMAIQPPRSPWRPWRQTAPSPTRAGTGRLTTSAVFAERMSTTSPVRGRRRAAVTVLDHVRAHGFLLGIRRPYPADAEDEVVERYQVAGRVDDLA